MKKTDLEKTKPSNWWAIKLNAGVPPGRVLQVLTTLDRREQHQRLDQAAGLVSFPVKLQRSVITALGGYRPKPAA